MKRQVILAGVAGWSLAVTADAATPKVRLAVNLSNSDNVTYVFTPYVEGLTVSRQPTASTAKPAASKWMGPAT